MADERDATTPLHPALALHTAARRWLIERHLHWCRRYAELNCDSKEGRATFPRYLVLEAILDDVEALDADTLKDVSSTRASLLHSASSANDFMTNGSVAEDRISRGAMDEERATFARFVEDWKEHDAAHVEPLAYRRTLATDEAERAWLRIADRFGIVGRKWVPIVAGPEDGLLLLNATDVRVALGTNWLAERLVARGVRRVLELREYGASCETDASIANPHYNLKECFVFDRDGDWLVYASHEDSLTLTGWVADAVRARWSDWAEHVWKPWTPS
jgi:hypothetical protein